MLLKDSWIFSPRVDSSENLVFTIKIKKLDYSEAMRAFIFNSYNEWKTLDFEVVGMAEEDILPKLRQRLALVMGEYASKANTHIESLKKSLYTRYSKTSRSDFTREELEESIRFYQDWILYD